MQKENCVNASVPALAHQAVLRLRSRGGVVEAGRLASPLGAQGQAQERATDPCLGPVGQEWGSSVQSRWVGDIDAAMAREHTTKNKYKQQKRSCRAVRRKLGRRVGLEASGGARKLQVIKTLFDLSKLVPSPRNSQNYALDSEFESLASRVCFTRVKSAP